MDGIDIKKYKVSWVSLFNDERIAHELFLKMFDLVYQDDVLLP